MGIAYRGHNDHIGTNHTLQALHLAHFGDASLNESHILVTLNHQQRQSNTQLRIITHRRGDKSCSRRQGASGQLLDDGLAIRACNTYYHTTERSSMCCRQTLQRLQGIIHAYIASILGNDALTLDHKGSHARAIHRIDIVMRIVVLAAHGYKHCPCTKGIAT